MGFQFPAVLLPPDASPASATRSRRPPSSSSGCHLPPASSLQPALGLDRQTRKVWKIQVKKRRRRGAARRARDVWQEDVSKAMNPKFPLRGGGGAPLTPFSPSGAPRRAHTGPGRAPQTGAQDFLLSRALFRIAPLLGNCEVGRVWAHLISPPSWHLWGPGSQRNRRPERNTPATGYREGRAPRPARPRREGQSTACAPQAAGQRRAPRGRRTIAPQDPSWPQPQPRPSPA